jgi:hypothetical protein
MSGTITPSPAAGYSTALFSDAEKADIRRFCGYPAYGGTPSGFQSWRYFQVYGLLEFRLNNLAPAEFQIVRYYVSTLYGLESAVPGASGNLDTDQAAVWTHNKDEVRDRARLFDNWRRRLCGFLGIPPGPDLASGNTIGLIV